MLISDSYLWIKWYTSGQMALRDLGIIFLLPGKKVSEVPTLCLGGLGVPEGPGVSQGWGIPEQMQMPEAERYLQV